MSAINPFDTTTTEEFLRDYWQRKPLLIRNGLPNLHLPFDPDELAGLSLQAEVESRLVQCVDPTEPKAGFSLEHGPFAEEVFQTLPETNWTLLVQAVDLWVPELKGLLEHFSFLPPWRLDDIMVSFAVPGGGVGPHFDLYDVFLVQAEGTRRWQIGQACDAHSALVQHSDLATLADFAPQSDWLLEPGDILYVPPGIAHWGIAETAGTTLSVGFRSPSISELLDDLTVEITAAGSTAHLEDPPLTPAMATNDIHPAYLEQIKGLLNELLTDDQRLGDWLARYMTRPKYPDLTEMTEEHRVAHFGDKTYVNGEPNGTSTGKSR